jgi:pyruvate formate lyase activating enzyme
LKVCIFDIKRFALHDGPGIRTTVFFKGCPLDCWWCHNPEGIATGIEHYREKITFDGVEMQQETGVGKWIGIEELMDEMERDRVFMEESGGGITFSGGEPLLQADALFRLLELAGDRNLHSAVDTCGYAVPRIMERTSAMADLILYDLKTLDPEKHKKFTGVSNERILKNLETALEGSADVVVRIPIVSGFNDSAPDIGAILDYLSGHKGIRAVDILPYHPYGIHKYRRFGREIRQAGFSVPVQDRVTEIREQFSLAGFSVRIGG